jgi:hypothetical protein
LSPIVLGGKLLSPLVLGEKIVEPYSVRRENLMPVNFFTANGSVCEMDFVLCRSCTDIRNNPWVTNRRAAGLCHAARGHFLKYYTR